MIPLKSARPREIEWLDSRGEDERGGNVRFRAGIRGQLYFRPTSAVKPKSRA